MSKDLNRHAQQLVRETAKILLGLERNLARREALVAMREVLAAQMRHAVLRPSRLRPMVNNNGVTSVYRHEPPRPATYTGRPAAIPQSRLGEDF